MKFCSKCHIEKDESEFYKNNKIKIGLSSSCRKCHAIVNKICFKKRGADGIEARKKSYKKWYRNNIVQAREQRMAWVNKNYEHYKAIRRDWARRNKHKALPYIKEYQDKARKELSDHYIKRVLRTKHGIYSGNATQDLVELQRVILKIKRKTWKKRQPKKRLQTM